MKKIFLHSILLLFTIFSGLSQGRVHVSVDTTIIRIGEQIEYKISVHEKAGVTFPKLQLDSLTLEEVASLPVDSLKEHLEKRYILTGFDSGKYIIPKQLITIRSKNYFTDSIEVSVAKVKVDTLKQKIFDIKSVKSEPKLFDDFIPHLWWLIPLLLIAGILLFYFFAIRGKQEILKAYQSPVQIALKKLIILDDKPYLRDKKFKLYYSELTNIIRDYLERDFDIPALESTSNELLERIELLKNSENLTIEPKTLEILKTILFEADLVKFAKQHPLITTVREHREGTTELIKQLHSTKPKDEVLAPKCPITKEPVSVAEDVFYWTFYGVYNKMVSRKIFLSASGSKLHQTEKSFTWILFEPIAKIIILIPKVGGTLLLFWIILMLPVTLVVVIYELILKKKILSRGLVRIDKQGKLIIKKGEEHVSKL